MAALAWVLFQKRRREGSLPWVPLVGFLVTIWFWTIYTTPDRLVQYVIPALHSLQYLYFVWLMKRNEARAAEGPPTSGPPVAARLAMLAVSAGCSSAGGAAMLDETFAARWTDDLSTRALGATPFFAACFVALNLHHYFMDHALWRREHLESRYLGHDAASIESPG